MDGDLSIAVKEDSQNYSQCVLNMAEDATTLYAFLLYIERPGRRNSLEMILELAGVSDNEVTSVRGVSGQGEVSSQCHQR